MPHLALSLGIRPGEMIFRSMFYGTPQASHISSLAAQLIDTHEALVRREIGERGLALQSDLAVAVIILLLWSLTRENNTSASG
ncbi:MULTISPECIES: hypothetical protein [Candidatus Ichthyocystis]|uniref:hypothetical protein n=1 Tax=Candidatus Ichthyocystis TaxID=2929841 RepID=UPI000B85B844|nr:MULTISPECIES: hypothetical protein [Ichthyocystis]